MDAVLIAVTAGVLAALGGASVTLLRTLARLDSAGSDLENRATSAPDAACTGGVGGVRVYRLRILAVEQAGLVALADAPSRALVAASRCGAVDTLVLGMYVLGLTGVCHDDGATEVRVGVTPVGQPPQLPYTTSPSLSAAVAEYTGMDQVDALVLAWKA